MQNGFSKPGRRALPCVPIGISSCSGGEFVADLKYVYLFPGYNALSPALRHGGIIEGGEISNLRQSDECKKHILFIFCPAPPGTTVSPALYLAAGLPIQPAPRHAPANQWIVGTAENSGHGAYR